MGGYSTDPTPERGIIDLTEEQHRRGLAARIAKDILGPEVAAEDVVEVAAWITHGALVRRSYYGAGTANADEMVVQFVPGQSSEGPLQAPTFYGSAFTHPGGGGLPTERS